MNGQMNGHANSRPHSLRPNQNREMVPVSSRRYMTLQPQPYAPIQSEELIEVPSPRSHRRNHEHQRPQKVHNKGCALAMVVVNVFISLFILILGCVCTGLGWAWWMDCNNGKGSNPCISPPVSPSSTTGVPPQFIPNCAAATPLWQGILATLTSAIGVAAIMGTRRSLLIAFQVMTIVTSLFLSVTLIAMAVYMGLFSQIISNVNTPSVPGGYQDPSKSATYSKVNVAIDAVIFIVALIYIILSVATSGMLCYTWSNCCPRKQHHHRRRIHSTSYDNFSFVKTPQYMMPSQATYMVPQQTAGLRPIPVMESY